MRKTEIQKLETEKAKIEAEQAIERFKIVEALEKEAQLEEQKTLTDVKAEILAICEREGLFCGIILDAGHIANIVKIAIENKDIVNINFELYFKKNQ